MEKAIDRPLQIGTDPKWKLSLVDRDVRDGHRMKMLFDQLRDSGLWSLCLAAAVYSVSQREDELPSKRPAEGGDTENQPEQHPTQSGKNLRHNYAEGGRIEEKELEFYQQGTDIGTTS